MVQFSSLPPGVTQPPLAYSLASYQGWVTVDTPLGQVPHGLRVWYLPAGGALKTGLFMFPVGSLRLKTVIHHLFRQL